MPEEFVVADNLDIAWSNFDPFFTLPADCPFYVGREDKPLNKLKRALFYENTGNLPNTFSQDTGDAVNQQNLIYWLQMTK